MKYHDPKAFQSQISNQLPQLCLILTKETEEQKHLLKAALKHSSLPLLTLETEAFSPKEFRQEVETLPFFGNHKLLVLHEIDQLSLDDLKVVQAYVERPNAWVSLFLTASSLPPQSKLVGLIDKKGILFHAKSEKPWEQEKHLAEWLIREAREEKVRLSQSTASYLVKGSMQRASLRNELEKLICYTGKKGEITLEDVQSISAPLSQETLWQLGDAIFWCKKTESLRIGQMLVEEGMVLFLLIANLRSQVQSALHILTTFSIGGEEEVVKAFPYLKGRFLEKKISMLKNYGFERLNRALVHLLQAELKLKNSAVNPQILLEILLAKLTDDTLSTAELARIC